MRTDLVRLQWCGETTYEQSGYAELTKNVTEYPIPIYFSETGCNTVRPRTFADQAAIFGPKMAPYWSGSIVYEWIQEVRAQSLYLQLHLMVTRPTTTD